MGSRGQKFQKEINGTDIILEVKGYSYQNKIYSNLKIDVEINGKIAEKALKYSIIAKGSDERPRDQKLYCSELQQGQLNGKSINFKQCVIPDIYICSDENYKKNKICIELKDCQREKIIGTHTCFIDVLILNKYTVKFNSSTSCTLFIDPIKNYSFIDYLRGGMQINLSIAIDFTASNLEPNDPKSLHYLSSYYNQYEMAIKSCGNIIANYDYNKMFATYGFGGKFYGKNEVDHCFPLNGNENNPEIFGIDGVLKTYREALTKTKLTDGIIEDSDDTIDALIEASFLPISVIIIGIGNADFTNMNILDADDAPLSNDKQKSSRDLVQFVPFNNYRNDPIKLAEEVLEEIPRQIVEYYQHQNISPKEPIVNISVKSSDFGF